MKRRALSGEIESSATGARGADAAPHAAASKEISTAAGGGARTPAEAIPPGEPIRSPTSPVP